MEKRCTPELKMGLLTMGIVVNLATGKDEYLRKKKKKKKKKKGKKKTKINQRVGHHDVRRPVLEI